MLKIDHQYNFGQQLSKCKIYILLLQNKKIGREIRYYLSNIIAHAPLENFFNSIKFIEETILNVS